MQLDDGVLSEPRIMLHISRRASKLGEEQVVLNEVATKRRFGERTVLPPFAYAHPGRVLAFMPGPWPSGECGLIGGVGRTLTRDNTSGGMP